MPMKNSASKESLLGHSFRLLFCAVLLLSAPLSAVAGQWQVIPIRLDLDQATRSGVLSVTNQGEEPLTVDVVAYRWFQDQDGQDQYKKSDDLIFFPKTLTIAPGKERVIRTGLKVPAVAAEQTYRLFIEEKPSGTKPAGTGVALAIRFGVPIYLKPVKPAPSGQLGPLVLQDAELQIPVINTGNVHARITTVQVVGLDAAGNTLYDQEQNGWYLLHGSSRMYTSKVPAEACGNLDTLTVKVQTDLFELNGTTHVDKAMCQPRE